MFGLPRPWKTVLLLSLASLLSFLARTFLDYAFVYEELGLQMPGLIRVTFLNLAFFAGWIWALVSVSHRSRGALLALLSFDTLLVVFGLATLAWFCPSPCRTAWPLGEAAIWSNLLIGVPAVASALLVLRQPS